MPPKTPRFVTPSSEEQRKGKIPRFAAPPTSSQQQRRAIPKFVSSTPIPTQQKRPPPVFLKPPPGPLSDAASRRVFGEGGVDGEVEDEEENEDIFAGKAHWDSRFTLDEELQEAVATPTRPQRRPPFVLPSSTVGDSFEPTPSRNPASRFGFAATDAITDEPPGSSPISTRKRPAPPDDNDEDQLTPPSTPRRPLPFTPTPATRPSTSGVPLSQQLQALRAPPPPPQSHMLPVDWSPTKRRPGSTKYLPDGLAATVAGWVLETRNEHARGRGGGGLVMRVREEMGFVAVELEGEEVGLLLIRGGEVKVGQRVWFQWPWWEVEVNGRRWRVCVFWGVEGEGG